MKFKLLYFIAFIILLFTPKAHSQDILQINDLTGKKGGTLVLALLSDPRTFNPLVASTDQASASITTMMFDGLTQINVKTQEVQPAIEKSWEVSKDGKEWIFHLRKGIKW